MLIIKRDLDDPDGLSVGCPLGHDMAMPCWAMPAMPADMPPMGMPAMPAGMPPTGMPAMPAGMPPTGMPAMPAMPLSGASRVGLVEKHGISKFDGLPPGKHSKNYGKSSFLMGKSTINDDFQ